MYPVLTIKVMNKYQFAVMILNPIFFFLAFVFVPSLAKLMSHIKLNNNQDPCSMTSPVGTVHKDGYISVR